MIHSVMPPLTAVITIGLVFSQLHITLSWLCADILECVVLQEIISKPATNCSAVETEGTCARINLSCMHTLLPSLNKPTIQAIQSQTKLTRLAGGAANASCCNTCIPDTSIKSSESSCSSFSETV